jgi:phage antirepressor YoqD-like protein
MYRLNGVMTPYQNHIDAGRFEVKTGTSERNNHAFAQARFTPKGVQWIAGLWASHTMQEAA